METLYGLTHCAWHIIGWEECRVTYNQLLSRGQWVIIESWIDLLCTLNMEYYSKAGMPPNTWYFGGVDEVVDYYMGGSNERQQQPIPDYKTYEPYQKARFPGHCSVCSRMYSAGQGLESIDYVQDGLFCSLDCAKAERKYLFMSVPELCEFYQPDSPQRGHGPYPDIQCHAHYYIRPLPYREVDLRHYLENMPRPNYEAAVPIDWRQYKADHTFIPRIPKNRNHKEPQHGQEESPPADDK